MPFGRRIFRCTMLLYALAWLMAPPVEASRPPSVVVSVVPVHALAAGVMAGIGEPALLVRGGVSPHGFQLRPSDLRLLREADLVIWVGEELESFLVKPLSQLPRSVTTIELLDVGGVEVLPARAGGVWGDDEHGGTLPASAAGNAPQRPAPHRHGHAAARDHAMPDPHLWLDPHNARIIVGVIAEALVRRDPQRATQYQANAERLVARLDELDRELEMRLTAIRHRPFIVLHDAYQYLERRYRLAAAGAITVSPDRPPSAKRLSELRRIIEQRGAVCVFREPQFSPKLVKMLVDGTSARTTELDPEGSANLQPGVDAYFTLLRRNADALVDCLTERRP